MNSTSVRSRQSLLSTLKEATLSHQVSTRTRVPGSVGPSQPQTQAPRLAAGQGSREGGLLSFFKVQASGKKRKGGSEEGEGGGRGGKAERRRRKRRRRSANGSEEDSAHHGAQGGSLVSLATATVILLEEVGAGVHMQCMSTITPSLSLSSPPPSPLPPPPLLPQVDVLFDNDKGFWSGVYELIETTRRPIILTCNGREREGD